MALGMVVRLPESDQFSRSRAKIIDDIAIGMAGRVAEEIIFGPDMVTTGASSDIQTVTHWAKNMVEKWGMSTKAGVMDYSREEDEHAFRGYSNETRETIDSEIREFLKNGYETARSILTTHRDQLDMLAEALLDKETMTGNEIRSLLGMKPYSREEEMIAEQQAKSAIETGVEEEDLRNKGPYI